MSRLVVPTNLAIGTISLEEFYTLVELYEAAADAKQTCAMINDGMRVHNFLRFHGRKKAAINKDASEVPLYGTFICKAIEVAWYGISNPAVRNLLRRLVGEPGNMPVQEVPVEKLIVRTAVLGGDAESVEILDALKNHHEQPKQDSDS